MLRACTCWQFPHLHHTFISLTVYIRKGQNGAPSPKSLFKLSHDNKLRCILSLTVYQALRTTVESEARKRTKKSALLCLLTSSLPASIVLHVAARVSYSLIPSLPLLQGEEGKEGRDGKPGPPGEPVGVSELPGLHAEPHYYSLMESLGRGASGRQMQWQLFPVCESKLTHFSQQLCRVNIYTSPVLGQKELKWRAQNQGWACNGTGTCTPSSCPSLHLFYCLLLPPFGEGGMPGRQAWLVVDN